MGGRGTKGPIPRGGRHSCSEEPEQEEGYDGSWEEAQRRHRPKYDTNKYSVEVKCPGSDNLCGLAVSYIFSLHLI